MASRTTKVLKWPKQGKTGLSPGHLKIFVENLPEMGMHIGESHAIFIPALIWEVLEIGSYHFNLGPDHFLEFVQWKLYLE